MRFALVTGARAEFGYLLPIVQELERRKKDYVLFVTGQHLSEKYGHTVKDIEGKVKNMKKIEILPKNPKSEEIATYFGVLVERMASEFSNKDWTLLAFSDRWENFAAVVAASYCRIPIAHIHGGDRILGTHIDNPVRHAITKLAHVHFPATKGSAKRIEKLGEEKWRIHTVGSTTIDDLVGIKREDKGYILVSQHPVTTEAEKAEEQMTATLEAVLEFDRNIIVIYPNLDVGSEGTIAAIENYVDHPKIAAYKSLPRERYKTLFARASVIVGNSSSALIEAPFLKVPAVNIGTREAQREHTINVIEANYDKESISKAIKKALSKEFATKMKKCKSIYGNGRASKSIVDAISKITIDEKLMRKPNTY